MRRMNRSLMMPKMLRSRNRRSHGRRRRDGRMGTGPIRETLQSDTAPRSVW